MSLCTELATELDSIFFDRNGVDIWPSNTKDDDMELRTGSEVAHELRGRVLLRYMPENAVPVDDGTVPDAGPCRKKCWVTITPYGPTECIKALDLDPTRPPRPRVLLLDPKEISNIRGPRRIAGGLGFEYVLTEGYPSQAHLAGYKFGRTVR